jgi:hypothetical protein
MDLFASNIMKIVCGDLFDTKAKYLAHQCNCVTTKSAHLSKSVFEHYPYADIYSSRTKTDWKDSRDKPGSIIIKGDGENQRYVLNLLGQFFPGRVRFEDSVTDGYNAKGLFFIS